jgi:UDP-N-acetylglucosamine 2-epimerase
VILRPATERWELVERGDAALVPPAQTAECLDREVKRLLATGWRQKREARTSTPYGAPRGALKARATARVVREVRKALGDRCPPDPTRSYL